MKSVTAIIFLVALIAGAQGQLPPVLELLYPADPQRTWPVGQLKPNDFGLFDLYGNVWEWTQDRMLESLSPQAVDVEDVVRVVLDTEARSRRGGAFPYEAAAQRSAGRATKNAFPMLRRDNVGFRVARTYR